LERTVHIIKALTRQSRGTAQKRAAPYFYVSGHAHFAFFPFRQSQPGESCVPAATSSEASQAKRIWLHYL